MILFLLLSWSTQEWVKDLLYPLFFPLYIFLLSFIFWKKELKISTSQFPFFPSLIMVFLLSRTNLFPLPILNCFVAIIFFQISLTVLVLLSNILRLKFSILPDLMVLSTLLLSTSLLSEAQYFNLKIHGDIWDSYSTANFRFISTSIFTLTKLYQWSNA